MYVRPRSNEKYIVSIIEKIKCVVFKTRCRHVVSCTLLIIGSLVGSFLPKIVRRIFHLAVQTLGVVIVPFSRKSCKKNDTSVALMLLLHVRPSFRLQRRSEQNFFFFFHFSSSSPPPFVSVYKYRKSPCFTTTICLRRFQLFLLFVCFFFVLFRPRIPLNIIIIIARL